MYDGQTINLMLNYLSNPTQFKLNSTSDRVKHYLPDTWTRLFAIAYYAGIGDLQRCCCNVIEHAHIISNCVLACYEKFRLNKTKLCSSILIGLYKDDEVLSNDFLSACFVHGMQHNIPGIIRNLLPIYCPTDEQMKLFTMSEDRYGLPIEKFMAGKVPKEIIVEFVKKYVNKSNNPKGVDKFMHRMTELLFNIG